MKSKDEKNEDGSDQEREYTLNIFVDELWLFIVIFSNFGNSFNHALMCLLYCIIRYIRLSFRFIFISNSCVFVSSENGIANENNHDAEPQRKSLSTPPPNQLPVPPTSIRI